MALWLALARWAAARNSDTSYLFVASSGHELDYAGMRGFLAHSAPSPKEVTTWLHLGAGIATYDYRQSNGKFEKLTTPSPMRRLYTNRAPWAPVLRQAFRDLADLQPIVTDSPAGEMALMSQQGYGVWGFAGGNPLHHMPGDRAERITGPELLEPVARAVVEALLAIENGEPLAK